VRIGVEACTWSNKRGYGRFLRELLTTMIEDFPEHEFVLVVDEHSARDCDFPERATVEIVATTAQPTEAASADGARSPADLLRMARAVARVPLDVFFFPTRYSYFPLLRPVKTVIAFHDATAERHPRLIFPDARARLFWRIKTWLALRQADRLVTVSEDARRQIADVFKRTEGEIGVITEGPDPVFGLSSDTGSFPAMRARYGLPSGMPIVLYVGGISPHKNLDGLLRAMEGIPPPWHLALVGEYEKDSFLGCHAELVELAQELGLTERLTFTGFVPDEDLALLYNDATVLVLPSFSEGFGLPVIEAMVSGLPVAASDRNSIPEVLGDAGLLFDPLVPDEIHAAVLRLLEDGTLRAECRKRGLERAKLYSWSVAARRMMTILEETAG
jgi:glycosyltransferase involved in cell wall biosynthesis